jgi:hypothetical protein
MDHKKGMSDKIRTDNQSISSLIDFESNQIDSNTNFGSISKMPYVYKVNSNFKVMSNKQTLDIIFDEFSDIVLDSDPHLIPPEESNNFFSKNPFIFYQGKPSPASPLKIRPFDIDRNITKNQQEE